MADRTAVESVDAAGGPLLRLLALDAEDLSVVSAHLQDAVVLWGDMAYLPAERRFVLVADRFDWCALAEGRTERLPAGLHFDGVTHVSRIGAAPTTSNETLTLFSISFQETDRPAGRVFLTFSEGAAIRLDVECLEAQLRDLGPRRSVADRPEQDKIRAVDDGR